VTTIRGRLRPLTPYAAPLALALVVGAMSAIMFASHRPGHWWGDDWALYIRQAKGLLDGNARQVIDDNSFTVQTSRGSAFSPPLYPWGFPILLTPFVAIVGTNVDRLAIVPVLSACAFACCWYVLAKARVGTLVALTGVVAITLSPLLLGWTELIQSELPFMAVTGLGLVGLDRAAGSGVLTRASGKLWPLVLLGCGAAAAFSVRREGLAMVPAIAGAQLAALIATRDEHWWRSGSQRLSLSVRLAIPHATALAVVGLVQVMLPSTLVPQYSGTTIKNVWRLADKHIDHLAEVVGLKRSWQPNPMIFGNVALGWVAVGLYLLLAVIGIGLALGPNRRRDLHLVVYAAVALTIGGSFRVAINRYVCSVAPVLMLLALVALTTLLRNRRLGWLPTAVATLALAGIVAGNLANVHIRIDRASTSRDRGQIEWGPTHPDAIAMFDVVRARSDPDDVIAAPKARAMTLETDRRAVQVDDYRPLPTTVELKLIVTERAANLTETLLDQPDEFTEVWRNSRFVVFQPNKSANAATNGAGSSSTASP
jgi:4-amino-4-deoxy-L-arabinose transferase-like glycosyltransferase